MDLSLALRAFIRTVEKGSVTGAARDLDISQPAVTKHLRNLERHVNARLLERSARAVRPTAQGQALFEASRPALASIDAALEGVRRDSGRLEGTLRLFAPACIGAQCLHPLLIDFQRAHPGIAADLVLDGRNVDLVYENFDLALRYGRPEGTDVVARRVGTVRRLLVASPGYLADAGPIDTLEALATRPMVATAGALSERDRLMLVKDGESIELAVPLLLRTNVGQVLVRSLKDGHGPGPVQKLLVADEMARGELVRILPDYEVKPSELYLSFPSTRFLRPAVRAFADFIVPRLKAVDGID
ncbi:LysR family transcriptional regulator [Ancylobacter oerskovii]|uniref:LysR family transcriptional regulator n=1 Tax=Ancylobacter oerskovii TaxID=459519 RepID=A0ABW4Z101_9HYPH|nr:LysR family transcriptional regulator [Ancylobacter oerskovii]MBS7542591.1 LysR family transcriptional regulator [Ancylobacter oerskovii]